MLSTNVSWWPQCPVSHFNNDRAALRCIRDGNDNRVFEKPQLPSSVVKSRVRYLPCCDSWKKNFLRNYSGRKEYSHVSLILRRYVFLADSLYLIFKVTIAISYQRRRRSIGEKKRTDVSKRANIQPFHEAGYVTKLKLRHFSRVNIKRVPSKRISIISHDRSWFFVFVLPREDQASFKDFK